MISDFSKSAVSPNSADIPNEIHYFKKENEKIIQNCKYCGGKHAIRSCPAFGKQCSKCTKKNHFAKMCRARSINDTEEHDEVKDDVWHIT